MSALVFVDSHVVVYRFDTTEQEKHEAARRWLDRLWSTQAGRASSQVLHETYATLSRKLKMPRAEARQVVGALHAWGPVGVDQAMLEHAWQLEDRWSLAFWDALIVAGAFAAGAEYLLSEDFQAGQDFDGVHVVNPFAVDPDTLLPDA